MKTLFLATALLCLASFAAAGPSHGAPTGARPHRPTTGVGIVAGPSDGNNGYYFNPYPYLMNVGPNLYSTDPTVVIGPNGTRFYDPLAAMRARILALQMQRYR